MKLSMQAKIGLIAVVAALCLAAMIVWKGDISLTSKGYELIGSFNNAGGIMPGAEVRYRGFKVGKVTRIDPAPTEVKIILLIQSNIKVPEGSTLRVAFDGLIGQKYVEIMPTVSDINLKNGSTLPGFSTLGIVDFIDIGTQNLEESKQILQSIRKITSDPVIQSSAKQIMVNIEHSTYEINKVASDLAKTFKSGGIDTTLKNLNSAVNSMSSISKKLEGITTALDELASDPNFTSDIKDTAKNAKDAFEEFKKASQDASKLLKRYSK
jgi:phospholipid/cholesterol/gamma-HCH transport system substrate-binding protein